MTTQPPKYTIYELLEALVERTGWQSEAQKLDMLQVVYAARDSNAVGVIGVLMSCSHHNTNETVTYDGFSRYPRTRRVCGDCGRVMG